MKVGDSWEVSFMMKVVGVEREEGEHSDRYVIQAQIDDDVWDIKATAGIEPFIAEVRVGAEEAEKHGDFVDVVCKMLSRDIKRDLYEFAAIGYKAFMRGFRYQEEPEPTPSTE